MEAIEFAGVNMRVAENQPEYQTLPVEVGVLPLEVSETSTVSAIAMTACFKLDPAELEQIQKEGCIFLTFLTFGRPMQPIYTSIIKPELEPLPTE